MKSILLVLFTDFLSVKRRKGEREEEGWEKKRREDVEGKYSTMNFKSKKLTSGGNLKKREKEEKKVVKWLVIEIR